MAEQEKHWGQWIKRRACAIGVRSQCTLALQLRCSRQQLVKWLAMDEPPASMRKGFDSQLAAILKTDPGTLFRDWRKIAPDEAPVLSDASNDDRLRRKLAACAELLPAEKLRKLVQEGESLLRQPAVA